MNKIAKILAILLLPGLFACTDSYLDTELRTRKADGNYYATPEECEEALIGCYAAMQLIWADGVGLPVAATVMADMTFGGTGASNEDDYRMMDEHDSSVAPGHDNLFEQNWIAYYQGIFRCNQLINRIDQADWEGREGKRNEILAEARFLRAYLYFDMVRMFERVPLLTEATSDNVPQADPVDTYTVIAEDLMFAVDNARATTYGQIAPADHGHVNKWGAKSLLAKVYLYYTGYYGENDLVGLVNGDEALSHLEDVIDNSGYGLVDNYFDLWPAAATYQAGRDGNPISENTYAGETNEEVIFAIKYTYTSDYDGNTDGNHWMVMFGLRNQSFPQYGYAYGWGAASVLSEVYQNWDAQDDRREASIIAIEEEGLNYDQHIWDAKEYTGYYTKKYIPLSDEDGNQLAEELGGVNMMIGQYQDYFSIRFADVLLMAAELGSPNALDYVNEVRERSGLDPVSSVDKDVIYEERRKELAFEGIWYFDMLRYDHTLQYAANQIEYNGTVLNGDNEEAKVRNGANILETRGLFQIPYNQITLSDGVITQNPGW